MIAATILPLVGADGDPAKAVVLASALAIMTGLIMIAAGAGKLGFVADLLSKPTILGYMNGLALTILVGQLPKLLGFSVDADGFIGELVGFVQGIAAGEVVVASALIGLFSLAIMLVLGRVLPKVPAVLVAVVVAIALSIALGLAAAASTWSAPGPGHAVVHDPDGGLRGPVAAPPRRTRHLPRRPRRHDLDGDLVRRTAGDGDRRQPRDDRHRHGQRRCRPVPGIPGQHQRLAHRRRGEGRITHPDHRARRRRHDRADAHRVPRPARRPAPADPGAVVIAASISLADLPATRRLYAQRRADFLLSMAAFLGVVLLGVLPGIVVAIVLSVANVFRRIWWPYRTTLGRVDGIAGLHDVTSYPERRRWTAARSSASTRRSSSRTPPPSATRSSRSRAPIRDRPGSSSLPSPSPMSTRPRATCSRSWSRSWTQGVRLVFAELKDPARRKVEGTDSSTCSRTIASTRQSRPRRPPTVEHRAGWVRPSGEA